VCVFLWTLRAPRLTRELVQSCYGSRDFETTWADELHKDPASFFQGLGRDRDEGHVCFALPCIACQKSDAEEFASWPCLGNVKEGGSQRALQEEPLLTSQDPGNSTLSLDEENMEDAPLWRTVCVL
jgi:hypothetical protein